jgi:hypothetical protein
MREYPAPGGGSGKRKSPCASTPNASAAAYAQAWAIARQRPRTGCGRPPLVRPTSRTKTRPDRRPFDSANIAQSLARPGLHRGVEPADATGFRRNSSRSINCRPGQSRRAAAAGKTWHLDRERGRQLRRKRPSGAFRPRSGRTNIRKHDRTRSGDDFVHDQLATGRTLRHRDPTGLRRWRARCGSHPRDWSSLTSAVIAHGGGREFPFDRNLQLSHDGRPQLAGKCHVDPRPAADR